MSKVIFIDVDGTLTNYENVIPDSAKCAIQKVRRNGHKVYICTGRSKAEIPEEIINIGLDGMILGNGSYVESDNQLIMHRLITKEQCQHIVDWLTSRGLEFYLESNNGLFASKNFAEKSLPALQIYMNRKGRPSENLTVAGVFPDMIYDGELIRDDLNKVSFLLNSYQD
ncbi:MAG: HAD hydrolase family protein, partial [Erysipelotrichaceae bacterium]|nr:HAD hydrolase family protein [Erysipelotrichaceae bacterium]